MRRWVWLGWVSIAVLGCARTIGGVEDPRTRTIVDPGIADPAASFEQAKAAGSLDPTTCQQHADAFDLRFQRTGNALHRFNTGVVWEACGEPEKAEAAYVEAASAKPKLPQVHNNLGALAYRDGRVDEAVRRYEKALELKPTAIAPRHNLAHLYRERYRDTGAIADFERSKRQLQAVLAVDSENLEAYEGLARLYYDRAAAGDRSYALLANLVITQAQRTENVGGDASAELWNLRGLLAVLQREPTRALASFNRAIERDPDMVDARLNAALIELELRNFEAAEKNLTVASKLAKGARASEAALALGVAKRGMRDFGGAEKAYTRANQLDPTDPRAFFNMGILYQDHIGPSKDTNGLRENEIAKARFQRFLRDAGADSEFAEAVTTAKLRVANIDEYAEIIDAQEEIQAEVERLEALERKEREERRKELLRLEREAKEALEATDPPPNGAVN